MDQSKQLNLMTVVSQALHTIMAWYPASGNRKDGPQIVVAWCMALDDVPIDLIIPGVALLRKRADRDFMPSALTLRDCVIELYLQGQKDKKTLEWNGPFGDRPELERKNRARRVDFETMRKLMEK